MLTRTSTIAQITNPLDVSITPTVQHYAESLTRSIVQRASEFAAHCGRQRVQLYDVTQAASPICMACTSYDSKRKTCVVYGPTNRRSRRSKMSSRARKGQTRSRRQRSQTGGTLPTYICGGNKTQCSGATTYSNCVQGTITAATPAPATTPASATGGGRRRHKRRSPRTRRRTQGGATSTYSGFCGGTDFLTQCAFSETVDTSSSGGLCYGGRTRRRSSRRNIRRGGRSSTSLSSSSSALSSALASALAFPNTVLYKTYVKEMTNKQYDVQWTPDALTYLDRAVRYHLTNVLTETVTRAKGNVTSQSLGATSKALPALSKVIRSYGFEGLLN